MDYYCDNLLKKLHLLTLHDGMSRCSVVGMATSYVLDHRGAGVRFPVGSRIATSPYRPNRLWDPPDPYPMGTGDSFPETKKAGM
jgi:hypothetical protein